MRSPDRVKDQTYFLSRLRQDQLSRATFPIGEYTKQEVSAGADDRHLGGGSVVICVFVCLYWVA